MKYIIFILGLFTAIALKAQNNVTPPATALVPAIDLQIGWHKTTLLVFPATITSADRGDKSILAERVRDASNMLKVKAGQKDFEPSNLNVVTGDGKVYTFNISYSDSAPSVPLYVDRVPPYAPVTFEGVSLNSKQMEQYSSTIAVLKPFLRKGKFKNYGLDFHLQGIYIKDDVLFIRYNLKNTSSISYTDASLRFYVRDKKKAKRTAEQDKETIPLYVLRDGNPEQPDGQTIVAVFPKFTIAERKYFTAELMEIGGDRNPFSKLDQKLLFRAKRLR